MVKPSPGIAPHTEETWSLLLSKHPESDCPIAPPLPDVDTPIHSQILFIDPDCTHTRTIYDIIYGIQGCEQSGTRYVDKSTVRDCRNSINQIVQWLWIRMITYTNINLSSMYGSVYSY